MNTFSPVIFEKNAIAFHLGQISAEFLKLEEIIEQNIWTTFRVFLKLDEHGSTDFGGIVTSQLNFDQKLSLFSSMVERIFKENSENTAKIRSFHLRSRFLHEKKEQLMHSSWAVGEDHCLYVEKHPHATKMDGHGDPWQKICENDLDLFVKEIQKLYSAMILSGMMLEKMVMPNLSNPALNLKERRRDERKSLSGLSQARMPFLSEKKPFLQ